MLRIRCGAKEFRCGAKDLGIAPKLCEKGVALKVVETGAPLHAPELQPYA